MKRLLQAVMVLSVGTMLTTACSPKIQPPGRVTPPQTPPSNASFENSNLEDHLYAAKNSQEALLVFDHQVEMDHPRKPGPRQAEAAIEAQLLHLFGPMAVADYPAVPRGDHRITKVRIAPKPQARNVYLVSYHYEGTIVVKSGPRSKYTVLLPINPGRIFKAGMVRRGGGVSYPCTDEDYTDPEDFWYFWNPYQPGCPLQLGRDFLAVNATLRPYPKSIRSYPEYDRLVDKDGVISIHILLGMDDPDTASSDPRVSRDENAGNYRDVRKRLTEMGFKGGVLPREKIQEVLQSRARRLPFVEEYVKETPRALLVVRLFFGPTGIDENSRAFHYFFKHAIENASVMIYDGHSGLGGHLDLRAIEEDNGFRIRPNPDRYQIYFFNSCSSYTYYNSMFFERKRGPRDPRGTKNLDVLTNGLATYFDVMHDTNAAVIGAIDTWATGKGRPSYQELAGRIDSDNLFGVNGDEDNPRE